MFSATLSFLTSLSICVFIAAFLFATNIFAASTISGGVYDKQRNPLTNVEVELLDDVYRQIGRTQTDGSGRYHFYGIRDGRYTIKVYAFRYDLQDQEYPVEVNTQNIRGGEGTGYFQQDFYLVPKKGSLAETELAVIFAQEVPSTARTAYDAAVKDFASKRYSDGIEGLNRAISIFPDYYLALHRMGKELFMTKRYQEAVPFFLRASDVNAKSATTFYYLGYSLLSMGKDYNKSALIALNNAFILAPGSTQVLYALGRAERAAGKFTDAEKHLLQAKKLSKVGIPEIHKELAQLYADDLKKYKEAADELEAYLKASKLEGSPGDQTRKVINSLREKAKSQVNN